MSHLKDHPITWAIPTIELQKKGIFAGFFKNMHMFFFKDASLNHDVFANSSCSTSLLFNGTGGFNMEPWLWGWWEAEKEGSSSNCNMLIGCCKSLWPIVHCTQLVHFTVITQYIVWYGIWFTTKIDPPGPSSDHHQACEGAQKLRWCRLQHRFLQN